MAVTNADYQLAITSTADTSGVDKAAAGIKGMSEAAEHSIITHREAHQALHLFAMEAGNSLGPIGELTHLLGNPYIMALAGASLAVKMLTEQHAALHEQLVKNIAASNDLAAAQRVAADEATREQSRRVSELADHYKRLGENVDHATERMRENIATRAEHTQSEDRLSHDREENAEAHIHERETLGEISSPEAHHEIEQAQTREADERQARHEHESQEDIDDLQNRRASAAEEEAAAKRKSLELEAAGGKRDQAEHAVNKQQTLIDDLGKPLADMKTAADEAAAYLKETKDGANVKQIATAMEKSVIPGMGSYQENLAKLKAKDDAFAQGKVDSYNNQLDAIEKAKDTKSRLDDQLAAINRDIESAKNLADKRDELTRQLDHEIKTAQRHLDESHQDYQQDRAITQDTNRTRRRTELEAARLNHTITPAQQRELDGLIDNPHPAGTDPRTGVPRDADRDPQGRPRSVSGDAANFTRQLERGEAALLRQRPANRSDTAVATLQQQHEVLIGLVESGQVTDEALLARIRASESTLISIQAAQRTLQQRLDQRPPM